MAEKLFGSSSILVVILCFLACSAFYNIGYFSAIGNSFSYFLYTLLSLSDIFKTGFFTLMFFGIFLMSAANSINFISWNKIKEIKFRRR